MPVRSQLRALGSALLLALALSPARPAMAFLHPGGLHTQADYARMAAKVAANASPWVDSYNQMTTVWMANLNMPWHPVPQIIRGVSPNNYARSQDDALAIYYHALRWRITGDTNYAEEAIRGCDAWSGTMTNGVGGNSNWALGAGICGYEFAVAGEALRGYTNWSPTSISNFCNFLRLFAVGSAGNYGWGNESFLAGHNGACDTHYWCNWDACNVASLMAIGVFCDDTNMFNSAVSYIQAGNGNGNLSDAAWYVHTNGLAQWQESGRDQAHTMDGIAWLGVALQVAWNQGVDLYGFDHNRYLRGLEYSAKYNLWQNVPFTPFGTCDSGEGWGTSYLNAGSRGFLPPTWDLFYNHYVNVKGLAAPYTAQAAAALRPDGLYNNANSPDFLGFTTLTCLLDPIGVGAVPGGVTARIYGTNILLNWWGSAYATNYNIKRATVSGGPYTTIGTVSAAADRYFADEAVTNGGTYYYVVSALDKFGESPNSPEKKMPVGQLATYYRFDEGSGTNAADASGLGSSANLMNGAAFAPGRFGNAVRLNGASQYVALPNGVIAGLGDFTIATWVNLSSVTTWTRIFDFSADTDHYMFLTPSSGSTIRFSITKFSGNGEEQINGTAPLGTGWHHVAVTLQGTIGRLYVDGQQAGENDGMFFPPDMIGDMVNATNNFIGRSAFSSDPYLNGLVEDFRIYHGALSASQITALYALTPAAPAAPAAVTATPASANNINLAWSDVPGATNYLVQRFTTNGGPYAVVASGVTASSYVDSGLTGGTTYYYTIAAENDGGTSTNSLPASATTLTAAAAPTGLTATGLYGGQIALAWSASDSATSYNVKRSLFSGGPYVTVATGVPATSYTNDALVFNATYYYVVSAVNANGEGSSSPEASSIVPVPTLNWRGNVSTNWDLNQATNWLIGSSPSTYFVDGAAVIFNDTATASLVNLSAGVAPYSITFSNTSLNYTLSSTNGSSLGGGAILTKYGTGAATLNTTNTFTGGIAINGGTLAIGGGGVLGGGNYAGNILNYGTFSYNSSAAQTLSGNISLSGGVGKSGTGTLTFTKANDYSGATTVSSGLLALTDHGGILKSSSILIGNTSGSSAAVSQAGDGTQVMPSAVLGALQVGSTPGGFGYYSLSSGNLNLAGEMDIGGSSGGAGTFGQFDMSGGNIVMPNSASTYFLPNRGAAGESSVVNFSGGTVAISANGTPAAASANGFAANWAASGVSQTNTTTFSGTAQFLTPSLNANLNVGGNAANVCNLNLNGGLLQVLSIPAPAGAARVNFNGGTLKAGTSGGLLLGGLQSALIYANGAAIDDNGQSVAVDQALLAPSGNGVSSIPVASGGAGYVMPPEVIISGGGGSNATACAVIANGGVTGIVVTCPGVGFTSAPTVKFVGGGYTTAATPGTAVIAANVSGGLTKWGAGTLTLGGSNNYTGPTVIGAGTLKLGGPLLYLSFDSTNGTTVFNQGSGGVAMNGALTGTNVLIVPGGHSGKCLMVGNGPVNTGYVFINSPVVNFNGSGAWTWGMWIKTTNAGAAYLYQGAGGWASGNTSFYLNSGGTTAGTKGGGVRYNQGWEEGSTALNDGKWHYIAMTGNNGTKTFYVDGAVDTLTVNAWSGSGTGSQLWIGGTADTGDGSAPFNGLIDEVSIFGRALTQPEITNLMNGVKATSPALPPNANVVASSGATLLLDTTSQTLASLSGGSSSSVQLAGSSGTALTFGNASNTVFAGSISGTGSVTKNGAGIITLSGANTYNGATLINAGTVKFGQSDNTNYVATLGPLLWFNFDQGVDATDGIVTNLGSGGPAMNGILNGNAAVTNSGRYGSALFLDGASYLEIDNAVTPLDCNPTGASWTYALWIKTSTAGAVFGYQGDGTWSADATTFYLNSNGTSAGAKAGGVRYSDGWLTGTATLNNNVWHFIAITVSGGARTIYVDGKLDAQTGTTGWTAAAMTSANQFLIGTTPDTSDGGTSFVGLIDEVCLFNRALSQIEITNLMANQGVDTRTSVTGSLPAASPVSLASPATLDLSGTTQTIASLSDLGDAGGLVTNSTGPATFILNNSGSNTFSGQMGDAPANALNLVKLGPGTQMLAGLTTLSGSTTLSNGTLLVNGSLAASSITVAGGTLGGGGSMVGPVTVQAGGSLWPGVAGTLMSLTCNNDLTLAGTTILALNKTTATNDAIAVGGTLAYGGTLTVTNLGGPLTNGDQFQLFRAPAATNAFATANLPALDASLRWNLDLASGALSVIPALSTNPGVIAYTISNQALTLSWPLDHLGWTLQVQTNVLDAGLGTNWVTVDWSTNRNQLSLPLTATNGSVFYRMVYP